MPTATKKTRKTTTTRSPIEKPKTTTNVQESSARHIFPFSDEHEPYQIRDIPLTQIIVPEGRREPKEVDTLAASIQEIGLIHPITVIDDDDGMYKLVSGRYRLAAHVQLERTHIPCHIVSLDALYAEIAEIDENLIRNELTELEYAEHLKRRKALHEQLHPETKRGGAPGKSGGGKKPKSPDSGRFVTSFLEDTAAKTGRGRSTIAESVQIATNLDDKVKCQIQGTPLEDRKTDLLRLARMTPEEQLEIAETITNEGLSTVTKAVQTMRQTEREKDVSARTKDCDPYQKIFELTRLYVAELAEKEGLQVSTNFNMASDSEGWINVRLVKNDVQETGD